MQKIVFVLKINKIISKGCVKDSQGSFDFIDTELRVESVSPPVNDDRVGEFTWLVRFLVTDAPLDLAWSASERSIYLGVTITPQAHSWISERGFSDEAQLILKVAAQDGGIGPTQSAELHL